MKVIRTKTYQKKIFKLFPEDGVTLLESEILANLEKWPVIIGTGGVRKARASRGDAGKSGGVRVLYYFWVTGDTVFFLDVYAKNEKDNIKEKDKKVLRSIIDELKKMEI